MTQRDVVLRMLRDAGAAGVHTFELRRGYIGNPSQRIAELEDAGYRITHTRERLNGTAVGTRYRLVSGGPPAVPAEGTGHAVTTLGDPSESTLFDPASLKQPSNPYRQEAA